LPEHFVRKQKESRASVLRAERATKKTVGETARNAKGWANKKEKTNEKNRNSPSGRERARNCCDGGGDGKRHAS
jgi:hypothetical protein